MDKTILLTVDVEDWFQVENFKQWIPYETWDRQELRVERNANQLLDLLDQYQVKATFFILGWIAERIPGLIRSIYEQGHEVASHGYSHELCSQLSTAQLKEDFLYSKKILEDTIGNKVYGYRAPSFSITPQALETLQKCGYIYDSSYNSFSLNRRHGNLNLDIEQKNGIAYKVSKSFYEIPISNIEISNLIFPWGGGGYFRLLPVSFFSKGVQTILKNKNGYLFYMHPWELDPEQPRVYKASKLYKIRHYINLNKTEKKLSSFIAMLNGNHFITCKDYIAQFKLV